MDIDEFINNPLSQVGRRYGRQFKPNPTADPTLLGQLGDVGLMSGLSMLGNVLDLPVSSVRDVMVGQNPIDQWAPWNWTSSEHRATPRDVLRKHKLIGKRDTTANWLGSTAFDIAIDPMTYTGLGLLGRGTGALTKGGKAAQAAGLLGDATKITNAGPRQANMLGSLGELVSGAKKVKQTGQSARDMGLADDAFGYAEGAATNIAEGSARAKAAKNAAKKMGYDYEQILDLPLGGLVKPLGPFSGLAGKTGVWGKAGGAGEQIAKGLDIAGKKLSESAPARFWSMLFEHGVRGLYPKAAQRLARMATEGEQAARPVGRSTGFEQADELNAEIEKVINPPPPAAGGPPPGAAPPPLKTPPGPTPPAPGSIFSQPGAIPPGPKGREFGEYLKVADNFDSYESYLRSTGKAEDAIKQQLDFDGFQYSGTPMPTPPKQGPTGPLFQMGEKAAKAEPFYKLSRKLVEQLPDAPIKTKDLQGLLKNKGVRPDEFEYTGLGDLLSTDATVTKQQVMEAIDTGIGVKEVVREKTAMTPKFLANYLKEPTPQNAYKAVELVDLYHSTNNARMQRDALDELTNMTGDYALAEELISKNTDFGTGRKPRHETSTLPGGSNYREILVTLERPKGSQVPPYKSPELHWPEENILASIRTKDRVGADGKKTLFVEEIQSDWHQKGQKKGYAVRGQQSLPEGYTFTELPHQAPGTFAIVKNDEPTRTLAWGRTREQALSTFLESHPFFKKVSDAPFKKNWQELAMKRVSQWAAEKGYDRVAWTKGEVHAKRWQQEKDIGGATLDLDDVEKGVGTLYLHPPGQNGAKPTQMESLDVKYNVTRPDVEKILGKEASDRLFERASKPDSPADLQLKVLQDLHNGRLDVQSAKEILADGSYGHVGIADDLDFKIGGERMKRHYDEDLVKAANKLGKKYGATVSEVDLPDVGKAWGFDVTPAMRESITQQGQPLFQSIVGKATPDPGDYANVRGKTYPRMNGKTLLEAMRQTRPKDADYVYALVEARASALGEKTDDYIARKFAGVSRAPKKQFLPKEDDVANGVVNFLDDGRAIIHAFEGANVSTLVHEVGHVFRRDLSPEDLAKAEAWAGVAEGGVWSKVAEEKFARGFERYLQTGTSPIPALTDIFKKFKTWLTHTYQRLIDGKRTIEGSAIDFKLSPEMKQVYDNLFLPGKKQTPVAPRAIGSVMSEADEALVANIAAKSRKASLTGNIQELLNAGLPTRQIAAKLNIDDDIVESVRSGKSIEEVAATATPAVPTAPAMPAARGLGSRMRQPEVTPVEQAAEVAPRVVQPVQAPVVQAAPPVAATPTPVAQAAAQPPASTVPPGATGGPQTPSIPPGAGTPGQPPGGTTGGSVPPGGTTGGTPPTPPPKYVPLKEAIMTARRAKHLDPFVQEALNPKPGATAAQKRLANERAAAAIHAEAALKEVDYINRVAVELAQGIRELSTNGRQPVDAITKALEMFGLKNVDPKTLEGVAAIVKKVGDSNKTSLHTANAKGANIAELTEEKIMHAHRASGGGETFVERKQLGDALTSELIQRGKDPTKLDEKGARVPLSLAEMQNAISAEDYKRIKKQVLGARESRIVSRTALEQARTHETRDIPQKIHETALEDERLRELPGTDAGQQQAADLLYEEYGEWLDQKYEPRGQNAVAYSKMAKWSDQNIGRPGYPKMLAERAKMFNTPEAASKARQHAWEWAEHIRTSPKSSPYVYTYTANQVRYAEEIARKNAMMDVVHHYLRQSLPDASQVTSQYVPLDNVFKNAEMDSAKAIEYFAKQGGMTVEEASKLRVAPDVADAVKGVVRSQPGSVWGDQLGKVLDFINNFTRQHLTIPFPAFHSRNWSGGQYTNLATATSNPREAWDYATAYKQYLQMKPEEWKKLERELEIHRVIGRASGERGAAHEAIEGMEGVAYDTGMPLPDFVERTPGLRQLGKGYQKAMLLGEKAMHTVEHSNRVPLYMYYKNKGYTPYQAALEVKKRHFDYQELTDFERNIMKRGILFYSFTRKMAPLIAETLMERPGGLMGQSIRAAGKLHDDQPQPIPQYIKETTAIPLGKSKTGDIRYITGLGLPQEDIAGFMPSPVQEAMSRTNPWLKALIESSTGHSMFQRGRPIEELDPNIGRLTASLNEIATGKKEKTRAKPAFGSPEFEFIMANLPTSRLVSTARTLADTRKEWWNKAMNLATGIKIADVSPAAQETEINKALAAEKKALGGSYFAKSYVPKDVKAAMTPEELQRLAKIEAMERWVAAQKKQRIAAEAKER